MSRAQPVRPLPKVVLKEEFKSKVHLEASDVQGKFGSPGAEITESNIDMVAMLYLSPEAAWYWLPRYFAYLKAMKKRDSFHYDAMLYRLSDQMFVEPLRRIASSDEVAMVQQYLDWWAASLPTDDRQSFAKQLRDAKQLWS